MAPVPDAATDTTTTSAAPPAANATSDTAPPAPPDVAATNAPPTAPPMPVAAPQSAPPSPPKETFGSGFQRGINGPQYTTDAQGNVINSAPAVMRSKGGILGALLGGALEGIVRGAGATTPEGGRGKGAAASAAIDAARKGAIESDNHARAIAQKNFENQQAATEAKLKANLITAQVHDLVVKSQHEEAEFPERMKELGLANEEHQISIKNMLDERRQNMANLIETLRVAGIEPYATVSQTPVDGKSLDQQAAQHATSLAQGVSMPVQNGKVGAQNGANLFAKADLDQPVTGNTNDPATWISVPHYDGTRDNQGRLISHPSIIKPDGKVTYGDVARQFMAADNELNRIMTKDAGLMKNAQERANLAKTQQETDPLYKLENDPSSLEGAKGPATLATAQARIQDPATSPKDKVRWQKVAVQAQNAIKLDNQQTMNKKAAEQAAIQGDPSAAAKLLVDGSLTLQELKARQVTPQFIVQTAQAAKQLDPSFTAGKWEADANIAKSNTNQTFFGNTDSLIAPGGTLDQLADLSKQIPSSQLPVVNKIEDIVKLQSGKGPLAAYAAKVLGVADDYSKVMTGGIGSDSSRQLAMDLFKQSNSPEQRIAAIDSVRPTIVSQRQGRIGNNVYLKAQHPLPDGAIRNSAASGVTPTPQTQQPTTADPFFVH